MELCEGGIDEFDLTTDGATFQLWEQEALVREHTEYLAATAAAAAPLLPTPAPLEAGATPVLPTHCVYPFLPSGMSSVGAQSALPSLPP